MYSMASPLKLTGAKFAFSRYESWEDGHKTTDGKIFDGQIYVHGWTAHQGPSILYDPENGGFLSTLNVQHGFSA